MRTSDHSASCPCSARVSQTLEPPWYGPVCPVVWEGRRREVPPIPINPPQSIARKPPSQPGNPAKSMTSRGTISLAAQRLRNSSRATCYRQTAEASKQWTRMKNPRCLVAAPVLAGRTQITALGTKPRLSLVACVFLVLAVPVARVQAQSDAPPPNAAASFVSGHLKCVAYYATMSECLSRFSQKDEMRYFNAAAAFLTRERELGGLYGEGPKIQEATTRELATVMERSVGSRCDNVRKLTDLRPLHDRYNDFCKVVGQKLQG